MSTEVQSLERTEIMSLLSVKVSENIENMIRDNLNIKYNEVKG